MRHRSFGDFVHKKRRDAIRQLKIIKKMLEHQGMKVDNFLEANDADADPYIYCYNPQKNGSFDGIRIYKVGENLAFRIQKENETHPYGPAYPLPIEDMFNDFMSDSGVDEKKAGMKIIESVGREVRTFFDKSVEAEKKNRAQDDMGGDSAGSTMVRTTGTDYSSIIYSKA